MLSSFDVSLKNVLDCEDVYGYKPTWDGRSEYHYLKRMENVGWVEQATGPQGGRRWLITEKGRDILACNGVERWLTA